MDNRWMISGLAAVCLLLANPRMLPGAEPDPLQQRIEILESLTEACAETIETTCTEQDGPERIRCLFDHYDEASAECQEVLDELPRHGPPPPDARAEAMRQRVEEACGETIEINCSEQDGPERVRCLFDHYDEVSAECQEVLDELPPHGPPPPPDHRTGHRGPAW